MKIQASNSQFLNNVAQGNVRQNSQAPGPASDAGVTFSDRLEQGFNSVANAQNTAAELAKNYEMGVENDLSKVMVGQQVSSLAFQLTLNVRNKALSAYKDIMNMPV
jgi:flagellar hook-basal body complex protein FliE